MLLCASVTIDAAIFSLIQQATVSRSCSNVLIYFQAPEIFSGHTFILNILGILPFFGGPNIPTFFRDTMSRKICGHPLKFWGSSLFLLVQIYLLFFGTKKLGTFRPGVRCAVTRPGLSLDECVIFEKNWRWLWKIEEHYESLISTCLYESAGMMVVEIRQYTTEEYGL